MLELAIVAPGEALSCYNKSELNLQKQKRSPTLTLEKYNGHFLTTIYHNTTIAKST